ncbi:MAG TPA: MlrC C-terminal domain-containing protein, partial [Thermomicrobiaceae bacterium]|nr:MlrC C-terminal domain-containing protein [Thermomicrobiaceae bacterium]
RTGASVLVYALDERLATRVARSLADDVWARRDGLVASPLNVEVAVHAAMLADTGTTLLLDTGDDPLLGGPADGTALLWALLDLGARQAIVAPLHDPAALARAVSAGPRAKVTLEMGARADRRHGYPITADVEVERITEAPVGSVEAGTARVAVVRAPGRHDGEVRILLTERRLVVDGPGLLETLGLDVEGSRIVGVKGGEAARRGFAPTLARSIEVATPGSTVPVLSHHGYLRLRRPIFPLDPL